MNELSELRKKVLELEKDNRLIKETEKKLQATNQQLQASEQQLRYKQETLIQTQKIARVGSWEWDVATDTVSWSDELFKIFRLNPEDGAVSYADHPKYYTPDSMQRLDSSVRKALESGEPYELDLEIVRGDGTNALCSAQGYAKKDKKGKVVKLFGSLQDITERKKIEDRLKKIEWLLQPKKIKQDVTIPTYGDLTAINQIRTILDSVGKEVLNKIVSDYLSLLETSAAVYEKNGDYAVGIFSSEWCQFLDCSSRALCKTKDNKQALQSGKWLCHESCWTDASSQSIQTNKAVDIECSGGLHIYAIPIKANNEVIGSINFGYGNPPTEEDKLKTIAANYNVSVDKLKKIALSYETRPTFIIDIAKEKLETSAKLIGNIVERNQLEDELLNNQKRYKKAQAMGHVGNWEYDPVSTDFWASDEAKRIYGYDMNSVNFSTEMVERCIPERERVHQALVDLLERNKKYDLEFDIITYDRGIHKTIRSIAEVDRDAQGNPIKVTGVISDITIQKNADDNLKALNQQFRANEQQLKAANQQLQSNEQQLKAANQQLRANEQQLRATNESLFASEKQFRNLFNSMQEGVYLHRMVYDEQGNAINYRIIEVNPISEEYLNIKREDAIGKLATELYETKEAPFIEVYAKVAETGKPVSFEQYFKPMNKYFIISVFSPIKGEFATVFLDITERKLAEISLIRANEELEKVQEMTHVGSWYLDISTNEVVWSKELYKMYGFNPELPVPSYTEHMKLFTPESWEILSVSLDQTAKNGTPYELELRTIKEDNTNGWMWVRGEAFYDKNKKIVGLWGAAQDISERKQAEKELNESEERFRELVNTLNSGVAIYEVLNDGKSGGDYIIREFNKFALKHEQLEKKDVVGKSLKDIRPNIDEYGLIETFQKVWKTGESAFFPAKVYVDEKYSNYYENRIFRLPSGEIVAIYDDVSDREYAIAQIKESQERFDLAMQASNDGVFDWNLETNTIYYSPRWKRMLGYEDEELPNDFSIWEKLTNPKDVEQSWNMQQKVISKQLDRFEMEFKMKHKDGHWIDILSRAEAIFNDEGKAVRIVGTHIDISERKQAELDLIAAKEKAEESDRLKSAFLANMSHEIRTPMNGILGFANLLKEPQLSGLEQQKYINIIEKSGLRMLNIINDIIDIAKIEAGLMTMDITESNINEQIEYIYTFFKPEVEKKGMEFSFKNTLPAKEAIINTDREKIFAILTNLVKNAIKYTNEGSIEFGYNKNGDFIEFYVKDTGIGIPKERQSAIFERFIQADISDIQAKQGAGLGLSISKAYVEMLNGKMWVESDPDHRERKGSIFYFSIPYNPALIQKTANVENSNDDNSRKLELNILIVEDDEISCQLLNIILDKYAKKISNALNGKEAVKACRNNPDIDLILLDIQLPELNGYEVTRQIREFNKEVIIIAQTAYGLTGDREKALAAGCNDYISKPVNKEELESIIQKHITIKP